MGDFPISPEEQTAPAQALPWGEAGVRLMVQIIILWVIWVDEPNCLHEELSIMLLCVKHIFRGVKAKYCVFIYYFEGQFV